MGSIQPGPPARGLQLWGKAEIIPHRDPRHAAALPAMIRRHPKIETIKKVLNLIQIIPYKIVLLDRARQGGTYLLWEVDKKGKEKEREIKNLRSASTL